MGWLIAIGIVQIALLFAIESRLRRLPTTLALGDMLQVIQNELQARRRDT